MTEPVARAASPRRTVRVAAALVAGQAVLCAVIGWMTVGSPGSAPPAASRQVAPLDAPPIVVPTASMAMPLPPAPATTRSAGPRRPKAATPPPRPPTPSVPARTRATTTTADEPPTTLASSPAETTDPASLPPRPELVGSAAPTVPAVQEDVVEGEPCDPPGARGRTVDGVSMLCVRGQNGTASWQIN